jgi:uncharacterized protein YjiK
MKAFYSLLISGAMVSHAMAAASLSQYTSFTQHSLSNTSEASGITYNWDTNTLFVVGDEGQGVEQYTLTGQFISSMTLQYNVSPRDARAVDDAEGIAYMGNNTFMIADERDQMGRMTTFQAGATRTLGDLTPTSYSFNPNGYPNQNFGIEGVSYDPTDGSIWAVKEREPLSIYKMAGPGGAITEPISVRNITRLEIENFSDIYVMANSGAFDLNDPRRLNLLILSRDNNEIVEITRTGTIVDRLSLSFLTAAGISGTEGITMDNLGNIYLASEVGGLQVLTTSAVPEPSAIALAAIGGLGLLATRLRRRK